MQNFDRNYANFMAPPTDRTEKCLVHFKAPLVPTDGKNSIQIHA